MRARYLDIVHNHIINCSKINLLAPQKSPNFALCALESSFLLFFGLCPVLDN